MPTKTYDIVAFGDSGFLVKFPVNGYDAAVTAHIHRVIDKLRLQKKWEEVVPGYNSLLAAFCPDKVGPKNAKSALEKALNSKNKPHAETHQVIEIPVCYGGEFGPDMDVIAKSSGLSPAQITECHSAPIYTVCMMGFVPGFTFLSAAPPQLHHDRRATPRLSVPPGSVGIAGWQTGIYGMESPGGWQIIGRTPLKIFEAFRDEPFLLNAADKIKFKPIPACDF